MDIPSSYRRSALKLIARVHRLGKHSDRTVSRAAVLTAVGAVVVIAWFAIVVDRVGLAGARDAAAPAPATAVSPSTQARPTVLSKRDAIVYLVAGDETHYHASVHAPNSNRKAVSISLARSRGLAPCASCFRGK